MLTSIWRAWQSAAEKRTQKRAQLKLRDELEKAASEARRAAKKKAAEEFAATVKASSSSTRANGEGGGSGCLSVLVLAAACFGCWLWFWPKAWYEVRYGVSADHVFIDPKPHDCEFMTAPMGDKNCHYEKVVTVSPEGSANPTDVYVTWQKNED